MRLAIEALQLANEIVEAARGSGQFTQREQQTGAGGARPQKQYEVREVAALVKMRMRSDIG